MVSRRARRFIFTGVAVLGALASLAAPQLMGPAGAAPGSGTHILATTASVLVATFWALGFAILAFRAEDEFSQQGSKFAWYWGAAGGIVASAPVYAFIGAGGLHWLDPAVPMSKALGEAFALGYGLVLGSQLVGVLAVSLWWKATRR
jgi:hypothetical protein